ncbi:MAG TPA: hypothetical protein VI300_00590, partial [Solirubrobacter sp.]
MPKLFLTNTPRSWRGCPRNHGGSTQAGSTTSRATPLRRHRELTSPAGSKSATLARQRQPASGRQLSPTASGSEHALRAAHERSR